MNKILTSVEIPTGNPEYLRFKYNDNSYQEYQITNNRPETSIIYVGDLDNGERKVCKDECVYYLIENNEQTSSRRNNSSQPNNFVHCIFLKDIRFHGDTFVEVTFDGAIFNEKATFIDATFKEGVSFNSAQFTKFTKFDIAKFNKETSFNLAKFNKGVSFNSAEFSGEVKFLGTIFNDEVKFFDTIFNDEVKFLDTIFNDRVDFGVQTVSNNKSFTDILYLPKFSKKVDFTGAIFNNLLNFPDVENINLDLKHTIIDRMGYDNIKFSSDNRETFLTLKNVALKQNDQIKALEFHTQEYQIHLKALRENKTNKNLSDRFVLTFESWVSAFGTNVILSIMRFVGVVMLFYVLINGFNYDAKTIVDFVSPLSYDIDKIFSSVSDVDRYLFFFYKILQVVLIYEMIKSFRKFSRTL